MKQGNKHQETAMTLEYMDKYGINNVRGGVFNTIKLTSGQMQIYNQLKRSAEFPKPHAEVAVPPTPAKADMLPLPEEKLPVASIEPTAIDKAVKAIDRVVTRRANHGTTINMVTVLAWCREAAREDSPTVLDLVNKAIDKVKTIVREPEFTNMTRLLEWIKDELLPRRYENLFPDSKAFRQLCDAPRKYRPFVDYELVVTDVQNYEAVATEYRKVQELIAAIPDLALASSELFAKRKALQDKAKLLPISDIINHVHYEHYEGMSEDKILNYVERSLAHGLVQKLCHIDWAIEWGRSIAEPLHKELWKAFCHADPNHQLECNDWEAERNIVLPVPPRPKTCCNYREGDHPMFLMTVIDMTIIYMDEGEWHGRTRLKKWLCPICDVQRWSRCPSCSCLMHSKVKSKYCGYPCWPEDAPKEREEYDGDGKFGQGHSSGWWDNYTPKQQPDQKQVLAQLWAKAQELYDKLQPNKSLQEYPVDEKNPLPYEWQRLEAARREFQCPDEAKPEPERWKDLAERGHGQLKWAPSLKCAQQSSLSTLIHHARVLTTHPEEDRLRGLRRVQCSTAHDAILIAQANPTTTYDQMKLLVDQYELTTLNCHYYMSNEIHPRIVKEVLGGVTTGFD